MAQLFPLIPILNPYGSHIVIGGQHWNHRGPISVSHGSHLGPQLCILKLSLFQDYFSFISGVPHIRIYLYSYRILPIWDLYGLYIGKQAHVGSEWDKLPESAHMVPIQTNFTNMGPIWVLYGQKSLYGAQGGPEWDKCPDSALMGPIYTCLLGPYSNLKDQ